VISGWPLRAWLAAVAGLAVVCVAPIAGAAEDKPPPPPPAEAFFARPELSQPRLSPSGRWVAVLLRGSTPRNLLAVIDLQTPGSTTVVARYNDADIRQVHWVSDERLVFDVVDLQLGSGESRFAPGLFSVQRDGGNLRQLVKLRGDPVVSEPGIGVDRRLSANHLLLHVPQAAATDNEVIVGEVRFDSRGNVESLLPRRVNVVTGRVRAMVQSIPENVQGWLFDPAGEPRVAVARRDGKTSVFWRGPDETAWRLLRETGDIEGPWGPHSVDAKGTLYVLVDSGPGRTRVLSRFDFATNRPQPEPLVSAPGFDFLGSLVSDPISGRLLGVRANTDAEGTVWLDPTMQELQTRIDANLPGKINRLSCRGCDGDAPVLLVESYADRDPGSVWIWRPQGKKLDLLGRSSKAIVPEQMATLDFHRIRARDGRDLPLWVTLPAGARKDGTSPAIVLVHGGPWVRGGSWQWQPLQQFLASRGYVVIEPEFRGSTGYGSTHFRAGWRQWGQAMQDDVADAMQWAVANKLIDAQRVCIAGASYGGYATLMGLVRHPTLYRCGAAWVAVTDPMRLLERSWFNSDDVSDEARRYTLPRLLGDVEKDAAMLLANSPLEQAQKIQAPLLLAYGDLDRRVPLVHGTELRAALRKAGREPEWIVYADEGHSWQKTENKVDFARRLEAFFDKHLK
jgi:dipeptidyl aminopeptidase/acylaminoacyl peptidase